MPQAKRDREGDSDTPAKKVPKRDERDLASRRVGEEVRKAINLAQPLRQFEATPGIRKTGLESLLSGDAIKADKPFGASFRRLGPGMDEFFSTATTREFVKGLLGDTDWSDYSEEEREYFSGLVNILSAIRVPTKFVGYSLDSGKMQHPTARAQAYFEDPYATASRHAELDVARRHYVQRAADAAIERAEDAGEIVLSAARAAIEFTLNNFMAPVTAANVQPQSKMAGLEMTDEKLLEQMRWREFLKRFYVDVAGGNLREGEPESPKASRSRDWNPQTDSSYPFRPPSPLRNVDAGDLSDDDDDEDEVKSEEVELDEPGWDEADERGQMLEDQGLNVFGGPVATDSTRSNQSGESSGPYRGAASLEGAFLDPGGSPVMTTILDDVEEEVGEIAGAFA